MEMFYKKSIWFDMDGVLVRYCADDYAGLQPRYLEAGYFKNLPADRLMTETCRRLNDEKARDMYVGILSKVNKDSGKYLQQQADKTYWLASQFTSMPSTFTGTSKARKAMAVLGRQLTEHDILIDDFNQNLIEWTAAGGCAVKYGKGQRDSWPGYSIQDLQDAQEIISFLHSITN
ncbi:TPA: hypothetical protein U2D23_001607 [Streptococcus suis]|nr:hypothetical protein [Streptococcus suis]